MAALPDLRTKNESRPAIRAEQRRLCAIIDSNQTSTDEKYQALIDLANLAGVPICLQANVA
jgi:hypothetical protein